MSSTRPSEPTPSEPPHADLPPGYVPKPRLERSLVFVVVFLGLLIVAGLTAVVLRIIYLASNPKPQQGLAPSGEVSQAAAPVAALEGLQLGLPAGAVVTSLSLDGDRLAVSYQGESGAGIAIVDAKTGARISTFTIAGPQK